ncbi:hypothetical protein CGCSCA5_v009887 [Colletotrichum siamense]|nr:hypothetical protein CGCSCA5_v009887 [Colletotrichum siamense]KAF4861378.1 hypothetical protein CGCSCA1_v014907 [Colletotrichum siamense]
MKLVIAGANGFVGTELVRQSLRLPSITSIIALSRRPVDIGNGASSAAEISKLTTVVVGSYDTYSDDEKAVFANADACIWTVAITPSRSDAYEWDEVQRVCLRSPLVALKTMIDARSEAAFGPNSKPIRFVYMSGIASERDQTKTPSFKPKYSLLRGEAESAILALAEEHRPKVEVCIAKPGWITAPNDYMKMAMGFALKWVASLPSICVQEISAAMLHQVVNGFEKDTLLNDDLAGIGRANM